MTAAAVDSRITNFVDAVGSVDPVAVAGARTRWDLGGRLAQDVEILVAPTGIVGYMPEEMTVRVLAGTPVEELHEALAQQGQWSALPDRGGTVGGAIAVGQSDYRRPARGDIRTAVLQVRYVSADGRLVTGGGPTVKNVSGFDLPRLLTGSLGTLGLIAEVIIRTNPIPPVQLWLRSEDADPFEVHRKLLAPGPILWDGTSTTVMLHGHQPAVVAEQSTLGALGVFTECAAPPAPTGHRWSLPPAELRTLDSATMGEFVAEVGVGIVHAQQSQPEAPLPQAVRLIHDRMKAEFDPTGRLNPGRIVGAR